MVKVSVPATSANIGSGFDSCGLALSLYNTAAFEEYAHADGLYAKTINGDAFSQEVKQQVIDLIKKDLGQVDMVVYSRKARRIFVL